MNPRKYLQQKHVVVVAVSTNAAAFWAVADHDVSESPPGEAPLNELGLSEVHLRGDMSVR